MPLRLTFPRVFGITLLLLAGAAAAVFLGKGAWAWTVGLIYLVYDTWLLTRMIMLCRAAAKEFGNEAPIARDRETPSISVIVPARNEASVLPACLDALLVQTVTPDEIWVVDDGSVDSTFAMLAQRYGVEITGEAGKSTLHPNLHVWAKAGSGKADSLNRVLAKCRGDVVVTIDADTVVEPQSVAEIREAFRRDENLTAGCGVLSPRCRSGRLAFYFQFFQTFEYLRAFLWRLAWSRVEALVLVSGAFAAYRRAALMELGGFDATSWVEDYELLYRLHRKSSESALGWRVRVIAGARGVTDAPASAGNFLLQRKRWFGGFLATLTANRDMVGNPRFGGMGKFLLPVKTIDTLLPVFVAVAQISLVFLLFRGLLFNWFILAVLVAKLIFDLVMHVWAMKISAQWQKVPLKGTWIAASIAASVLEPFFFQPLRYAGAIAGWAAFLRKRLVWESQRGIDPTVAQT